MFEPTLAWLLIGGLALFLWGVLLSVRTAGFGGRAARRFGTEIGLPLVSAGVSSTVTERVRSRTTAAAVGSLVGLAVCVPVLVMNPAVTSGYFAWLIVAPALLAGAAGAKIRIALGEPVFRQRISSPGIARSTATTLRDYVSPWRPRLAPITLALAGALGALGLVLGAGGRIDGAAFIRGPALPYSALALLVALGSDLLKRRILLRPRPAADTLEPAWDDAFRADTPLGFRMSQTLVSWSAAGAAVLGMLNGLDARAGTALGLGIGTPVFLWGWVAITFAFGHGGAKTRFRQRLWSGLPGLGPGDTRGGG